MVQCILQQKKSLGFFLFLNKLDSSQPYNQWCLGVTVLHVAGFVKLKFNYDLMTDDLLLFTV